MPGRIEAVNDPTVALAAYDPEDKVAVSVFVKDRGAREAIASEVAVGPDAHGASIEVSVYDSDFCDAWDEKKKEDRLSAYEEDMA